MSKFQTIRPQALGVEDAVYAGMDKIGPAKNVRMLQEGWHEGNEWIIVEYDWPDNEPYFDRTDDIVRPFGLELVKDWKNYSQERLR